MNLEAKLRKEEKELRKVNFFDYLYLITTIIFKKIFKIFNIEIKKKRKNFNEIYLYYLKKTPCIFDVGANTGQSIERFKRIFLNCIIHSFEPHKECFDIIKKKFNQNVVINNFALGKYNQNKNFNFNILTYTSSFLQINKKNKNSFLFKNKKKQKVKIVKLDYYVKCHNIKNIDILKIDTQGYELNVLKGGAKTLKSKIVKFIEIEITLDEIYLGNPKFFEIDFIMNKNNFFIYQLGEFSYENQIDKLKSFDVVYMKR